jgi:hypothetical protein
LQEEILGQAHYVINIVIDWILNIVFLKNNYFIPWSKWKLYYSLLMKEKPRNFEKRINEAVKVKSFDEDDVMRRIKILEKVWKDLK